MDTPFWAAPFVLPAVPLEPVTVDDVDLYLPPSAGPAPAVVLVHGGPVPAGAVPPPRTWTTYRGYGGHLAAAGLVGVMFDHPYHAPGDIDACAERLADVLATARQHPAVDADRVVLSFFSGGGVLAGRWLADSPDWVRGIALTYPVCAHLPGVTSPLPAPVDAIRRASVPVAFTRVEHEHEWLVADQAALLARAAAAGVDVELVDVPGARHGFEVLDDSPATRDAIRRAVGWAVTCAF